MARGLQLKIHCFNTLPSTQTYLIEQLKAKKVKSPCCYVALEQTKGVGSRGNEWISQKGNLFLSFCIAKSRLPKDLPLSACSIYFSMLLKEILYGYTKKIWVKWPNDFYVGDKKVGGTITSIVGDDLVCGIGVNLQNSPSTFDNLTLQLDPLALTEVYMKNLLTFPSWKNVLNDFKVEFDKSKAFMTHNGDAKISMKYASVCEDGALLIDGKRIFSLR